MNFVDALACGIFQTGSSVLASTKKALSRESAFWFVTAL